MSYNAIADIKSDLINGTVVFHKCASHPTYVIINLTGPKNSIHAIHIHEYGDTRKGCDSLGAHWNPDNTTHGSIYVPKYPRHAGDLINNVVFDEKGTFSYRYIDRKIHIPDIYGRSIVIHQDSDDLGLGGDEESLITGNAGKRIACAVIGIAEE